MIRTLILLLLVSCAHDTKKCINGHLYKKQGDSYVAETFADGSKFPCARRNVMRAGELLND